MSRRKHDSKPKCRQKASLPLSVVGLSLLAGVGAAEARVPATDPPREAAPRYEPAVDLYEEEVFDVSMTSFYVFDKENPGGLRRDIGPQLAQSTARRCGGSCTVVRCGRCRPSCRRC